MTDFQIAKATRQAGQATVQVLELRGQLDAHTFPSLQRALDEAAADAPPRVVLDCSALGYVSSAGLGVLKKMTRQFRDRGGDLRLAALPPKIASVIQLLGFDQVIEVHSACEDAVASYSA